MSRRRYRSYSKSNKITLLVCVIVFVLSLLSLGVFFIVKNATSVKEYTIAIESSIRGTEVTTHKFREGSKIKDIEAPQVRGYYFEGYYSDESMSSIYKLDLESTIQNNTTIYLHYIKLYYTLSVFAENVNDLQVTLPSGAPIRTALELRDQVIVTYVLKEGHRKKDFTFVGLERVDREIREKIPGTEDYKYTATYSVVGIGTNTSLSDTALSITYSQEISRYSITYLNEEGLEYRVTTGVPYHAENFNQIYNINPPEKTSTPKYYYAFLGWIPEGESSALDFDTYKIESNIILRAKFEERLQEYRVTFSPTVAESDKQYIKIYKVDEDSGVETDISSNPVLNYEDRVKIEYSNPPFFGLDRLTVNRNDFASGASFNVTGSIEINFEHHAFAQGYLEYEEVYGGYEVVGFNPKVSARDIPSTITVPTRYKDGKSVLGVKARAFAGSDIVGLVIEDGVQYIGAEAFLGCDKLQTVTFGEGLKNIEREAFEYCRALNNVTTPNSLRTIGNNAFYQCDSLKRLNIKTGVETIGDYAFGSALVETIVIPDTVVSIGDGAFSYWGELTKLTIGAKVRTIGASAFNACINLTELTIPASVESIGDSAFIGCDSVIKTSIYSPKVYMALTGNSENDAGGLLYYGHTDIYVAKDIVEENNNTYITDRTNGYYKVEQDDFYMFTRDINKVPNDYSYLNYEELADGTYAVTGLNDNTKLNIEIPGTFDGMTITKVADNAFAGSNIISLSLLEGVSTIGAGAFKDCGNLSFVTIRNGIRTIEDEAFSGCGKLSNVSIYQGLEAIGNNAFYNCSNLNNISLPNTVLTIGDNAFYGCAKLPSIELSGVQTIGENAFNGCAGLTSVRISSTITTIGANAFANCPSLTEVTIENANFYVSATSADEPTGLLANATTIRVSSNIVTNYENAYLTDTTIFSQSTMGAYKVFTKIIN